MAKRDGLNVDDVAQQAAGLHESCGAPYSAVWNAHLQIEEAPHWEDGKAPPDASGRRVHVEQRPKYKTRNQDGRAHADRT